MLTASGEYAGLTQEQEEIKAALWAQHPEVFSNKWTPERQRAAELFAAEYNETHPCVEEYGEEHLDHIEAELNQHTALHANDLVVVTPELAFFKKYNRWPERYYRLERTTPEYSGALAHIYKLNPEEHPEEFVTTIPLADGTAEKVEEYKLKTGKMPSNIFPVSYEFTQADATQFLMENQPLSLEDSLRKKFISVLDMSKQSLQTAEPRAVIAATMESLRKLQTLDGKFPQPLTKKSLWGILGDFVNSAHPTIVASREMLLYEMLPLAGVLLGDSYYLPYGSDKHFPSIFTLAIGRTSDGKGQAWHACQDAIELVDPTWSSQNIHSNPASGEALVRMLGGQLKMEGTHKKRVAIFNTEMSTSFIAQGRKDSSLSGFLRKAYDGDHLENYRSEGKKSTTADNYILGFAGTITPSELQQCMPQMDWHNGAQNRFLWSIAFKDKNLGRSTMRPNFAAWALRVQKLLALNHSVQPTAIDYSSSGHRVFDEWFHSLPEHDDSILAESQARVAANCVRVANLYAQLDERRLEGWKVQLEACHVEAAIEIVNRSRQSVEWYLAQQLGSTSKVSFEDIQKLKMAMLQKARDSGVAELSATEVYGLFSHRTTEERDQICLQAGFKVSTKKKTVRGKPTIVWVED
jgi:hypothetical protein